MIRNTLTAMALCLTFGAHAAVAQEVAAETQDKIVAMLAEMKCEIDVDNIEPEDDGYELDDVYCADGQYDMDLNADLEVTNKRKE